MILFNKNLQHIFREANNEEMHLPMQSGVHLRPV